LQGRLYQVDEWITQSKTGAPFAHSTVFVPPVGDTPFAVIARTGVDNMKSKRLVPLSLAIFLALGVAGCSDTGIGAGVGGGALVGSSVGHPWLGALVGGAGGAVAGHEIGEHQKHGDD
jgi:hypothetical protein